MVWLFIYLVQDANYCDARKSLSRDRGKEKNQRTCFWLRVLSRNRLPFSLCTRSRSYPITSSCVDSVPNSPHESPRGLDNSAVDSRFPQRFIHKRALFPRVTVYYARCERRVRVSGFTENCVLVSLLCTHTQDEEKWAQMRSSDAVVKMLFLLSIRYWKC